MPHVIETQLIRATLPDRDVANGSMLIGIGIIFASIPLFLLMFAVGSLKSKYFKFFQSEIGLKRNETTI
jgi:hypothetical protein